MNILELHTDERLRNPFISAFGQTDLITSHYEKAKVWIIDGYRKTADNAQESRYYQHTYPQIGWVIGRHFFKSDPEYLTALWYRYLKNNPEITWYIQQFKKAENIFNRKQENIIQSVISNGLESLEPVFTKLIEELKQPPLTYPEVLSIKEFATVAEQVAIERIPNIEELLTAHYGKPIKPRFLCRTEAVNWIRQYS